MRKYFLHIFLLGLAVCVGLYVYVGWLNSKEWKLISYEAKVIHYPTIYSKMVFLDKSRGFAAGSGFAKTIDGGKTWQEYLQNDLLRPSNFLFTNQTEEWAIGSEINGTKEEWENQTIPKWKMFKLLLMKTKDAGETWNKIEIDKELLPKEEYGLGFYGDLCLDKSGKIWIVGGYGLFETNIENNVLKLINKYKVDSGLFGLSCADSGDVWAVGNQGVFHLRNGQLSEVKPLESDTDYMGFVKVKLIENQIWLLGSKSLKENPPNSQIQRKGLLLKSSDNGKTWENKTPAEAQSLTDVWFNGGEGWLVGEKGSIYYTRSGGDSWTKQKSPTENDLWGIFFLDPDTGWISGDKATVLKLEN